MESLLLTDTPSRSKFFSQTALLNLRYWQAWLGTKPVEITTLDRERNRIIRGVSFALELEEAWPTVGELIVIFSPYMERRGHWDIWNNILDRAIQVARQSNDVANETTLSALMARLLFQQSRLKESVASYRRVIRLARLIGDSFNEARACSNLGYYYTEQGQWCRAETLCYHALQLFQQLGSKHGRAHTENHLGILYTRQHSWDQARQHLERACAIWESMGDEHGLMRGLLNMGLLYVDARQPEQALSYLEKAFAQAHLSGEDLDSGIIHSNIGIAYMYLENLEQAEAHIRQAEAIFQRYSNLAELSRAWNSMGLVYFQQNKWAEAMLYLEKSLELRRSLGIKYEEIEVLLDIGECELLRGNQLQAMARLQEVKHLIGPQPGQGPYRYLQPRLAQYQNLLMKKSQDLSKTKTAITQL